MSSSDARQKLIRFLEQKAFEPVLHAKSGQYPESKRDKLRDAQRRTEAEIERFQNYSSAEDVVVNFKRDLNSQAAEKVHRELKELGLPTINDIRSEFEQLAADLGVR